MSLDLARSPDFQRMTKAPGDEVATNRPFSKMAAENSKKLKLTKIENVYQHQKKHLYFSNPTKFQHFRCNISRENVS